MSKIRKLGYTIDRFNQGYSFYQNGVKAWQDGLFHEYETNLRKAATEAIGGLEWALKVYLRNFCRPKMILEDQSQLKQPNFNDLIALMEKYATPSLEPDTISSLYRYRNIRNTAEHDGTVPSIVSLCNALQDIRRLILIYLPVSEYQLKVVIPIEKTISLREYINLYNYKIDNYSNFSRLSVSQNKAIEAAICLGRSNMIMNQILLSIRRVQTSGIRRIRLRHALNSEECRVLQRLNQLEIISNLSNLSEKEVIFDVRTNGDWNFFAGSWLDIYVWSQARDCIDSDGSSLFDNCDLNLELMRQGTIRREIDVGCIYQGQLLLCSCKPGRRAFNRVYLDELQALSSLLGGTLCSRLFITNGAPQTARQMDKFDQYAKDLNIVVVTGEELANVGEILKREAKTPTFPRE